MSAARKAKAVKTGDPAGLTEEDKAENVAAFVEGLAKPPAPARGSSMESANACGLLGAVLTGGGILLALLMENSSSLVSLLILVGVGLLLLAGAVAYGWEGRR
jgi:hypothetical protein